LGMENNKGFYTYKNGDAGRWNEDFRKFSYQIQQIIRKYPFNGENIFFHQNLRTTDESDADL